MSAVNTWLPLLCLAVALIATGLLRQYSLRMNLLDLPNSRSSHQLPTPRGGGAAIVLTFFGGTSVLALLHLVDGRLALALLGGGGLVAGVGYLDDRKPQSVRARFAVHCIAAGLAIALLGGISLTGIPSFGIGPPWVARMIALIALVWVANLFNFMDGIDGIAGSEAVFAMLAGAWLSLRLESTEGAVAIMLCLAAACLGFLRWNWPPAKIFMGDVGSGFLGFSIGVLALYTSEHAAIPLQVWVILGGVFVIDASLTLIRRAVRGDRWFEAHRLHAYQRLARRWHSHFRVTAAVTAVNVFWLLPWAWVAAKTPAFATACMLAALGPLAAVAIIAGAGRNDGR